MLYLHVSNRTENLLTHLVEVLRVSGRRNIFAQEILLIQSQGMERMVSQTLAKNFVSWCNFQYFLPLGFLTYCAGLLDMEVTPDGYERGTMTWRIEELLRNPVGEEYRPVTKYLQGENLALKRYQLAEQLANIFDQYQLMRPEMLAAWEKKRLVTHDDVHEAWQCSIWRKLQEGGGGKHRGAVLQGIINRLQRDGDLSAILPERISVFGLSIMPPLFLDCLQGLGRHVDVHLYVLSPCREYWGDLELRRKSLLAVDPAAVAGNPQALDIAPENHPLLVSFGRQGRDFQRMLFGDQVRFKMEFASYQDPLETGPPDLLHRLQSDLLNGEVRCESEKWNGEDRSIQLVSCHSRLREITVLKEHILDWLYRDPNLQLRDIVVMAPDIQEYAALIPAVFDTIQHSISDRSLRRRNSLLAAFADFLELFQGRFCWDEMLDLVKEPTIAENLELSRSDLDNLQRWVTEAGVRWGLSGAQRGESGLPDFEEGSWQAGLARLLMGYAIDSDDFVADILPYGDIEGGSAAALGGLCRFVGLVEEARRQFAGMHSLKEWSVLLLEYADKLFNGGEDGTISRDFLELQQIVVELGETAGAFHQGMVDFQVITAWLDRTSRETRSSSGFLRGQLTFCSMLPMRSIPFKRVCLIGLNDNAFPRDDHHATFDLMGKIHRPGDRSRRIDDRYQFLEAVMAAREQLYISFIGQSIKNNESLPPSVVVTELLEVLENCYRAYHLLTIHPLHPFSSRYFTGEAPGLFSYDDKYCRVARALREPQPKAEGWWRGTRDVVTDDISVRDLFTFFRNPQRWFIRDCLGIRLDADMGVVAESEPFEQGGLEDYLINQEIIGRLATGDDPYEMCRKLQAQARWPLGEPGRISFAKRVGELQRFVEKMAAFSLGKRCNDLEVDLDVGGYRLAGRLGNICEQGILLFRYGTVAGRDLLSGWLHYLIHERLTGKAVDVVVLGKDRECLFSAGCGAAPDLETIVEVFVDGCREPSPLYIEPGIAWLKKQDVPEAAMAAACAVLDRFLENGFDREAELLLRGCSSETIFDESFVEMAKRVLEPIIEVVK